MGLFYNNFVKLCADRKVSPSGVAKAIGLSNAAASGWKSGKEPSDTTLQKIADYFGVPTSELTESKKAPATNGERSVSDAELKFALWGDDDIDDEDLEDVRRYAAFVKERKKGKK